MRPGAWLVAACVWCMIPAVAHAETAAPDDFEVEFIQAEWPEQAVREFEVDKYPVRWRHRLAGDDIFAGIRFTAPLARQPLWELTTDYADVSRMAPGVESMRYLEQSETRQVIELTVKVLWKTMTLTFEIEHAAPRMVRFRWRYPGLAEYRGVCTLEEAGEQTVVELSTWLSSKRSLPKRLLLVALRMVMLDGAKNLLQQCEAHPQTALRDAPVEAPTRQAGPRALPFGW